MRKPKIHTQRVAYMKHVMIQTYCDWPRCAEEWLKDHPNEEQFTTAVNFTISVASARGRKPKSNRILLCREHLKELTDLRRTLSANKQFEAETVSVGS